MIEAKLRAEQTMLLESIKAQRESLELLLNKLPEVLKHMPKETGGDVTTIHLGPVGSGETAPSWQAVGLALVPTLKKLLGGIAEMLHTPSLTSQGSVHEPENKAS